ncbi:cilia- and flagella-associated protein 337-like [Mixophyes fleayi]|uniref:cilia- and flagella-associated protein 337-like n=1 Tax=Mixophyes fleayi TaxID=3061075 RepID=UPI003F4E3612
MKTWNLLTGQLIGEVRAAHGLSAVTCLVLDSSGNRLFTGSRDGSVKQWDYTLNSVSLMKTIKQESSESSRDGISDLTYAEHNNNGYIIPVSCDGQIRIFPDQHGAIISEYECRQYTWSNNLRNEHEKGKLCLASSTSNLVATCNYNGEVLVWNLLSGDVFCHLTAPDVGDVDSGTGDLIINKIVFICSRIERKNESAVLIASGPRGNITFWNIIGGGKVFGRFAGSHYRSVVSDIAVSEDDSFLCAADQLFYVYIWNISHYGLDGPEEQPPVLLHCWRAHLCDITRVIPVKKHNVIVTSSQDCTVKLWSIQGEHIGTFGQNKTWCIKTIKSSDDRSNSQKQPSNALCESKQDLEGEQEQLHRVSEVEATSLLIDDNDIAKELKERLKMSSPKQVELQQASGKMNAYKSLQICDLMSVSATIRKPNPAAELNDPYDLAF